MLINVLEEVASERRRQDEKWGVQNHPDMSGDIAAQDEARHMFAEFADKYRDINDGNFDPQDTDPRLDWVGILLEEVYEAVAEQTPGNIRVELIQVAAVAVAWIEAIDRRGTDG